MINVKHDEVGLQFLRELERLVTVGCQHDPEARALELQRDESENILVVVRAEDEGLLIHR
jgi:hypothetical protein